MAAMVRNRNLLPILLLHCLPLAAGQAQGTRPVTLLPANATHPTTFSGIAMIRELSDGRLLVLDSSDKKIYVADFKTGKSLQVGRTGDGPQEYRKPMGLYPLPGDSTLLTDRQTRRWILFVGDKPVATIPPKSPGMGDGDGFVRGVDPSGRVSLLGIPTNLGRAVDQGDSLYLSRYSRVTGKGDTVARLRSGFGGPPGSATKSTPEGAPAYDPSAQSGRRFMMAPVIGDQAIGFADGWIAVARMDPYRVDWIDPSGKRTIGPVIPVPAAPLNDREKRAYLARLSETDGKPAGEPSAIRNWLPAIPPFWGYYESSLFTAPGGALVIFRAPTAALPLPTYDVISRQGTYRGQFSLKANERVIGFGTNSIYLCRTDAEGSDHIERHPWQ